MNFLYNNVTKQLQFWIDWSGSQRHCGLVGGYIRRAKPGPLWVQSVVCQLMSGSKMLAGRARGTSC